MIPASLREGGHGSNGIKLKTCKRCGKEFPRTPEYFYAANKKKSPDGMVYWCKSCHNAARRRHEAAHIEQKRLQQRNWAHRNRTKIAAKSRRIRAKTLATRPETIKARSAVWNALASGRLKRRPCEKCGDTKTHAHHDDYSKPLVVRWLCPVHHSELHKRGAK